MLLYKTSIFKPPPPVGTGGGYMFSGCPSVPLSVCPCVRPCVPDSRGSFMFPRYLQYLLTDFRQTFVTGASRDRPDYVFGSKGQSSRSRHRDGGAQHSTLPLSATFFCCTGKLFDWCLCINRLTDCDFFLANIVNGLRTEPPSFVSVATINQSFSHTQNLLYY